MFIISNLLILIFVILVQGDDNVVNTNYGKVKGEVLTTIIDKRSYYSFKGIPYAKPPIGDLRFKPSEKPVRWNSLRSAIEYGNVCIQGSFVDPSVFLGDEDCLYINVFTPDLNPKEKLPVVVGIHGGGFYFGNGHMMGPDFLIDQNVIFVTFNYRLGPLGFLSLGTPEYSGNMGLKDQVLALKWTNENIHHFGGDKDLVTIIGESAGGASVHYHLLSPLSKGLYKRAVVASGSAFNPWAFYDQPDHVQIIKDFGVRVNNPFYDYEDMVEFLKQVDAKLLTQYTFQQFLNLDMPRQNIKMLWAPVVEHVETKDSFLSDTPENIMNGNYESNVDMLFTYSSKEMSIVSEMVTDETIVKLNSKYEIHLPLAEATINFKSKAYKEMASKIRKHYFNDDGTVNESNRNDYIELIGIHKAAQIQARKSTGKTYNWIYSGVPDIGASHTEDTSYVFSRNEWTIGSKYENFSDEIVKLIKTLSSFVAKFATSGNPTPNQQPVDFKYVTSSVHNFLNITKTELIPSVDPMSKNFAFWDEMLETYFGKTTNTLRIEL